jgi:autotransporter-associated beta strand protein
MAANLTNEYPGCIGASSKDGVIALSADTVKVLTEIPNNWSPGSGTPTPSALNFRIYWDGDLLEETLNGPGASNAGNPMYVNKMGNRIFQTVNTLSNNGTKKNPCAQGDIFGDWREELVLRANDNKSFYIYTTNTPTDYRIPSLWNDHQYRQAMVWQSFGYNQPPHTSFFLGDLEGITVAPPPYTNSGRTELHSGSTITSANNNTHVMICDAGSYDIEASGASPEVLTVNVPSVVSGNDDNSAITYSYSTTQLGTSACGDLTGSTTLAKQGDGMLKMAERNYSYTGNTNVWAGSLAFSGTLPNSEVWMNRHTNLYTAGTFTQPVTMEYGSKLYICKDNATADGTLPEAEYTSATFSTLNLHEGARIIMNIDPENNKADALNVGTLSLRTQDWEYGPKYLNPVIEINSPSKIPAGTYLLGDVSNVNGNVNFTIEGNNFSIYSNKEITIQDGHLYLNVTDDVELEEPTNNAAINNTKDIIQTWDFKSISATVFNKANSWFAIGEEETTVANITCKNSTTEGTEGLVFDVTNNENIWRIVKEGLRNQGTNTRTLGITNLAKNDVITVVCSVYGTDNTVVSVNTGNAVTSVSGHTYTFTMTEDGTLGLNVARTANGNYYTIEKITRAPGYSKLTLSPTEVTDYEQAVYDSVIVAREFNAGYSTLCVPFNTTVSEFTNGDTEAYVAYLSDVKEDNGVTTLVFSNTTEIKANTPYILYLSKVLSTPTFIEKPVFLLSDTRVFHSNSWSMYGNYTPGFSMYGKYGVAHNAQIKKGGAASTLNAYGAYLVGPANATNAKIMFGEYVEEEEYTGISGIGSETAAQRNGKYAGNQQIIILHNGKKYRINGTLIK